MEAKRKEKLDNFWFYYKYHVLTGVIIIAIVLIGFWITGPKAPDADLNISVIGDSLFMQSDNADALENALNEKIPNDINADNQKLVYVNLLAGMGDNPQIRQRTDLEIMSGESKLLILDKSSMLAYANENFMMDLSDYAKEHQIQTGGYIYAIPIPENSFLSQYMQTNDLYVCIKAKQLKEENNEKIDREYENAYAVLDSICK